MRAHLFFSTRYRYWTGPGISGDLGVFRSVSAPPLLSQPANSDCIQPLGLRFPTFGERFLCRNVERQSLFQRF